jgi:hypothetical protein
MESMRDNLAPKKKRRESLKPPKNKKSDMAEGKLKENGETREETGNGSGGEGGERHLRRILISGRGPWAWAWALGVL